MPKGNESYFGVRLGEALASGAGHISDALQRKYAMQRQADLDARQMQQQDIGTQVQMASRGIAYDPSKPLDPTIFNPLITRAQEQANLERRKTEAEIARMGQLKAPTGYAWNPEGGLAAIPGGPAAQKIEATATKKAEAIRQQADQAQNVISTVDNALGKIGYSTAGWLGNKLSGVAGTEAADLEANLKTIKANLGFDRLTQMRLASPTGGALGQVSDREIGLLTSAVQNLEQTQSPTQLKKNLQAVKEHYTNWLKVMEQSRNMGTQEQNTPTPKIDPLGIR